MSKTLQAMPVFDRMYPGANYKIVNSQGLLDRVVSPNYFHNLASFKRFKLDDHLRIPTPSTEMWEPSKLFGHLMLPFPKVWIEWENRRDGGSPWWMAAACVHKTEITTFMLELFGADLSGVSGAIPESPMEKSMDSNDWVMFLFELTTGTPRLIPGLLRVSLDSKGIFHGVVGQGAFGLDTTESTNALVDLGWDALAAIGLLNCRNVTTKAHDRSKNTKKRRRPNRDKAATLEFSTIELPSLSSESISTGVRDGTMARHMARGHFKTFTEEAPLFGKYTGTYWWGWQLRGNRKNGEVISDYKVA